MKTMSLLTLTSLLLLSFGRVGAAYTTYGTVNTGETSGKASGVAAPYCNCTAAVDVPANANGDGAPAYYGCAPATGDSICSFEVVSGDQGAEAINIQCPNDTIPFEVYIYCENTSVAVGTYNSSATQFSLGVKNTDNDNNYYANVNGISCADDSTAPTTAASTQVSYSHCSSY